MELTDDVMNQVLRDVSKNISKERKKGDYPWQSWQKCQICR